MFKLATKRTDDIATGQPSLAQFKKKLSNLTIVAQFYIQTRITK